MIHMKRNTEIGRIRTMKTLAAFIVALSLFSAVAVYATADTGPATYEAGPAAAASPVFMDGAEVPDAWLLPGGPDQVRQPEDTAFIFFLWLIMCLDGTAC